MKVWILKEGEPLPCDDNPRLMRMGILAEYLAQQGHQVTWWSTTFIHGSKTYRYREQKELSIQKNETLVLLHSSVNYKKNTSFNRLRYNHILAQKFKKNWSNYEIPDIILCSYPTVDFASKALHYGQKNHVPVILDVRDFWPDIFTRIFPKKLKFLAKIGVAPLVFHTKHIFRNADAITGVVPSALQWGLKKAGREKNFFDRTIYIGYKPDVWSSTAERQEAIMQWQHYGVSSDTWNICFFGTMSNSSLDMDTCIKAVIELTNQNSNIRLILCGDGDALERYKKTAGGNRKIVFPGWVGKKQIQSLLEISKVGLYPYRNLEDFKNSYSNKIIGYMAGGLPVLSSLEGFPEEYIQRHNIGLNYKEGDILSCQKVIKALYQNEEDRQIKSRNSYQRFLIDFEASVVNRKFEVMMKEILQTYLPKAKEK